MDGWGRDLIYSISEDGTVSLKSFGADNAPGGIGDDAAIIRQFSSRNDDGSFVLTEIYETDSKR